MAEPGHPASPLPPSASPLRSTSQDLVRDGILEEQLGLAGVPAGADTEHTGTIPMPSNSGGGTPSLSPRSSAGVDEEGSTALVVRVSPSDPFPDQTPTLDPPDPSKVADPASGSSDTLLGLGPEERSEMVASPAHAPLPPVASPSSILSPPVPTPALSGPHPGRVQTPAPGPESAGPSTAQVSVVAAEQPAGGFSVSISFGGAQAGPVQMSGALVPGDSKTRITDPSGHGSSFSSVAWADEQVVLSEKQRGKQPVKAPDPTDRPPGPPRPPPPRLPLQAWRKLPDRGPQKLPIRFKDAIGRNYIWPWKAAKTWKARIQSAKRLIDAAFKHVPIIGDHVLAGHYDLFIDRAWEEPQPQSRPAEVLQSETAEASTSNSAPAPPAKEIELASTIVSPIVVVSQEPVDPEPAAQTTPTENQENVEKDPAEGSTTPSWSPTLSSSSSYFTASPPPSPQLSPTTPSFSAPPSHPPPPPPPAPNASFSTPGPHGVFILPELWDDIIEPGMYITMFMWPSQSSMTNPVPVAPPLNSPYPQPPSWSSGRGRARGRGNAGRGNPPAVHGVMPPGPSGPPAGSMPLTWPGRRPPIVITIPKPRGKTRKRQDGL